jgi:hypothetical protein
MYLGRMAFHTHEMKRVLSAFRTRGPAVLASEQNRYELDATQLKTVVVGIQKDTLKEEPHGKELIGTFNETDEEHIRLIVMGQMW